MSRRRHLAKLINNNGDVSPLCATEKPRSLNMQYETWTNREEAVDCPYCIAEMEKQRHAANPPKNEGSTPPSTSGASTG